MLLLFTFPFLELDALREHFIRKSNDHWWILQRIHAILDVDTPAEGDLTNLKTINM